MENDLNAGAEPANETSLRDMLSAEYTRQTTETPAVVETPAIASDEPQDGRARDEKGRFAPKPGEAQVEEPKEAAETAKPAKAAEKADEPVEQEEDKPARRVGPPPGWSVAAKAAFDELPAEVQAAVAKREEEIDRGFAKLKEYKELEKTLEPYKRTAQQYGADIPQLLDRFIKSDNFLRRDPKNALLWLAKAYNFDPRELAGVPAQPQGQPKQNGMDPALAPVVQPLVQEINSLKAQLARVDGIEQALFQDKYNSVLGEIERFGSDPKNKFFEDVADQMAVLIEEAKAKKQQIDLNTIYETACYMNPEVRGALIKETLTTQEKARAAKAKTAADQARQAGASITGGAAATTPLASSNPDNLRAQLEQAYADQIGRV